MKILDSTDTFALACLGAKKWGLYISFHPPSYPAEQWVEAAPYLKKPGFRSVLLWGGEGFVMFDTEAEMDEYYNQTVGEEGPTPTNPYNGPAKVYALTCSPTGEILTENT